MTKVTQGLLAARVISTPSWKVRIQHRIFSSAIATRFHLWTGQDLRPDSCPGVPIEHERLGRCIERRIDWMGNGCFASDYFILGRETLEKIVTNPWAGTRPLTGFWGRCTPVDPTPDSPDIVGSTASSKLTINIGTPALLPGDLGLRCNGVTPC